jgi:hypothetical protein
MLNDQFRMEKEIADIANLYYRDYGSLKSNDTEPRRVEERNKFYDWYPENKKAHSVELVDTSGLHAWVTAIPQGKSHSRLNCFSAALDIEMAFHWLQQDVKKMQESKQPLKSPKVLIVAPYKPHVERIKQLVKFEYEQRGLPEDANLIKAGTIHSFQGNEGDIVIFDLVLDEPHWRANLFMPDAEMNKELQKLFNVAVTRARFKLFVVGNIKYCRQRAKNNALSQLLDYLVDDQKFSITDAKQAFPNLLFAKPRVYVGDGATDAKHIICREDTFYEYFLEDVHSFKKRLIIYSPFITGNRISLILPDFKDAITAGKRIIVVTKAYEDRGKNDLQQYKKLEAELSAIGVEVLHKKGMHEKLVFIDDSAVWMGSLNALSFSGETGEIMHRHCNREITAEYEKIYDIQYINGAVEQKVELKCPICGEEMLLSEGNTGVYWKCRNGDYSRSVDQQYPYEGVLRCQCCGDYCFVMKNQPRWVCQNDPKHYQIMREGDLKLERMAAKIPTQKARKEVDKYFAHRKKADEEDSSKSTTSASKNKSKPASASKGKVSSKTKGASGNKAKSATKEPKAKLSSSDDSTEQLSMFALKDDT